MQFRKCVVGVFLNEAGDVLLGERSDILGSWQFPQGGIDSGENEEEALRREIFEELAISDFNILATSKNWFSYEFPKNIPLAKKYKGQEQKWFLLKIKPGHEPKLSLSDHEFRALKWVKPQEALDGIVSWKKKVYTNALSELQLL